MAARNISVPTNSCEIAAACDEAGDRVKAFVSYGDGMTVDYRDFAARNASTKQVASITVLEKG
jgi:hypothetical protein